MKVRVATRVGSNTFADLAETLVLLRVWVQDGGVRVEEGAVWALPAAL